MTSLTSDSGGAALVTAWQARPARHSIALRRGDDAEALFLRAGDRELEEAPPLSLVLSPEELAAVQAAGPSHATDYGPLQQDKHTNEDFALSAVLRGTDGRAFSFGAVADGVSLGSFFPERGARLAALAALRALAGELAAGADPGEEAARDRFRAAMHREVLAALTAERALLETADATPGGWARDTFDKHRASEERWFLTTLIVALIGERGGFVSVTGDGGVRGFVLEAGKPAEAVIERTLLSAGGGPIDRCVSLRFAPEDLTFAQISTAGRAAVHLVLASDGLELSMARIAPSHWKDLPLETSPEATAFLAGLARHPRAERDNLSAARVSWPLDAPQLAWGAWGREPPLRWLGGEGGR